MLDHQGDEPRLPERQRDAWHRETQNEVGTQRVGTYAGVLTPEEVALVERVAGSRMRRFGYAVADRPSVRPAYLLQYAKKIAQLRLRTAVNTRRDARLAKPPASVAYR